MRLADARDSLKRRRSDRSYSNAALNGFLNDARRDLESRKRWSWLRRIWSFPTTGVDSTSITTFSVAQGAWLATVDAIGPHTMFGKRLIAGARTIRVTNLNASGLTLTIDAPWPDAALVKTTVSVLYDEVALPLDADTALQVILRSNTGYARELVADTQGQAAQWDPSTSGEPRCFAVVRREPLPPPKAAPAAADLGSGSGPDNATYLYWQSFVDKQTGAESALSPSVSFTQSTGQTVNVTPSNRRDFLVRVYRSRAGGTVPYKVGDITAYGGTFLDTLTDEYLGARAPESATDAFLRLWPVPSAVYQVEATLIVRGVDLSDDNDRPLFPATYDSVWLAGAEALMLEAADEQGRANQARGRLEQGVQRMMMQDTVEGSRRLIIGGRGGSLGGIPVGWPDIIQGP